MAARVIDAGIPKRQAPFLTPALYIYYPKKGAARFMGAAILKRHAPPQVPNRPEPRTDPIRTKTQYSVPSARCVARTVAPYTPHTPLYLSRVVVLLILRFRVV